MEKALSKSHTTTVTITDEQIFEALGRETDMHYGAKLRVGWIADMLNVARRQHSLERRLKGLEQGELIEISHTRIGFVVAFTKHGFGLWEDWDKEKKLRETLRRIQTDMKRHNFETFKTVRIGRTTYNKPKGHWHAELHERPYLKYVEQGELKKAKQANGN